MGNSNKFWSYVFMGAIAGGAISLLDRETRKSVVDGCKKGIGEIKYYATHPTEVVEQAIEKTNKIRATVEQVSEDVAFIAEKVEELKEATPPVIGMVKETKEAFLEDEGERN